MGLSNPPALSCQLASALSALAPAQRAGAQRLCAMARTGPTAMSAVRSLTGVNRTWPERPDSVAIDPSPTCGMKICCTAAGHCAHRPRTIPHRRNETTFAIDWKGRHHIEGPHSFTMDRETGWRHHPRISDEQTNSDEMTLKISISLASFGIAISQMKPIIHRLHHCRPGELNRPAVKCCRSGSRILL
jgi:hypothetical protein